MTIIIGIISSLLASLIWFYFTTLKSVGGKKRIKYSIFTLIDRNRQFVNAVEYNDYETAVIQCDKMIELIQNVYFDIAPLTFIFRKRKIIMTLLFQLLYPLTIFKNIERGYSDEDNLENIARCEKYKTNYLNVKSIYPDFYVRLAEVQLEFLQILVSNISIKKCIKEFSSGYFEPYCSKNAMKVCEFLVNKQYCKNGTKVDFYMRNETLEKEEYDRIIEKILM